MTIKKQFSILASFIVAIPLFCSIFISFHHYVTSSSRYLMDGSKQIINFNKKAFSKKDIEELVDTLRLLPSDIEACVITEDSEIIFSTIPNLHTNGTFNKDDLWIFVNSTSEKYFYQFTNMNLTSKRVVLITRILRNKQSPLPQKNILFSTQILLIIAVIICIFFIILMSRTIFKSIVLIEKTTQQIADGNLTTDVTQNISRFNKNEITSTLTSIDKMRIALLEEQNRKTKFIMGISHDLRTPVSIIKGYLEAISDGIITDPEELNNTLTLIRSKTTQLESMIDTLINFMKLNNKEIRENLIPSSITKIINSFAKDSIITANAFNRTIVTNINIDTDIIIPLNEQLFLRSLENLFSNALRYTKDNDTIEINSFIRENNLILEIKDTGVGIEEKDLNYIFDMFYRGTNSRHEEGMGIGLSVVKNIIDTHGWNIDVSSKRGSGSCFTITIPLPATDQDL